MNFPFLNPFGMQNPQMSMQQPIAPQMVNSGQMQPPPVQGPPPQAQAPGLSGMFGGAFEPGSMNPALMGLGAAMASGNPGAFASTAMPLYAQQAQQRQAEEEKNKTIEWLRVHNPQAYEWAKNGLMSPSEAFKFAADQARAQQPGAENYSLTPRLIRNKETGEYRYFQPGSQGNAKYLELPKGYEPVDPYTEGFESSRGTTEGKLRGEKASAFPTKTAESQALIEQIDTLREHPGKEKSLGMIEGRLPNFRNDPDVAEFRERVAQLKGGAFLAARQQLKGGGQITDFEGERAEAALLRAEQAKTEAQFDQALTEFENHIRRMYEAYAKEAGQQPVNLGGTGGTTKSGVTWRVGE